MLKIILAFMCAQSSYAAILPQAASVIQGGGPSTALSTMLSVPVANIDTVGYVKICGGVNSGTANNFLGLYSQAGPTTNVAYSVPAGKSFYAVRMDWAYSGSINSFFQLLYGTAAIALGDNTATAPAGAVYYGASTIPSSSGYTNATAAAYSFGMEGVTFPAAAFPAIKYGQSSQTYQICIVGIVK